MKSIRVWAALPVVLALACGSAGAPEQSSGLQANVAAAEHHDVSPPLFLLAPAAPQLRSDHEVKPIPRRFNPAAAADPVRQSSFTTLLAPALSGSFDGVGQGFVGPAGTFTVNAAPPDTNGDIGPNHYVQTVNTNYAIFDKTGRVLYGPVPINTLWSGFGGFCQSNNDGDPIVLYDPISDRWLISQFAVPSGGPYSQCVAVSTTGDPTGSYNRYSFGYSAFPDYPKFGVWPDAYYVTFNMFGGRKGNTFQGATLCAYDRARMLTGAAATQQCFSLGTAYGGILPADLDGKTLPPAGSPEYFVGLGATVGGTIATWKMHVDWTTPANTTLSPVTELPVATFSEACGGRTCIPQAGTSQQLDSLADRVMYRLAYRNFGDHEAMVLNHSVTAGASTGVRWYELRVGAANTLSVFQQGTYAPDALYRWMGSIALDKAGNMALGFSVSSSATKPGLHYTGRLAGDPAGVMAQGEGVFIDGTGSQLSNLNRWGDYAMMGVDPVDDCTFWFTSEYLNVDGTFNWNTRISSFQLPGCVGAPAANDFSISATNATAQAGGTGTSTVTTALTTGTAETVTFTTGALPSGVTASFNPGSATAGGGSTLTFSTSSGTTAGTYTVTVTGTAASATHSTTITLTVTAPPPPADFSIALSPSSQSHRNGSTVIYTVTVASSGGFSGPVTLAATSLPRSATASFSPNPTATTSQMTIATAAGVLGTFTVTVQGTSGTLSHSASATLTLTKH